MKKSLYWEEQVIGILKQHEAGVKTADVCREHGISAATFYDWKQKFGGMEVSEAELRHYCFALTAALYIIYVIGRTLSRPRPIQDAAI